MVRGHVEETGRDQPGGGATFSKEMEGFKQWGSRTVTLPSEHLKALLTRALPLRVAGPG